MIGDSPITVFGETVASRAANPTFWGAFATPVTLDNTEKLLSLAVPNYYIYVCGLLFVNTALATTSGQIEIRNRLAGLTAWKAIQPNPAAPVGAVMGPFNFTQPIRTQMVFSPFTGQQSNLTMGTWVCYLDAFVSSL